MELDHGAIRRTLPHAPPMVLVDRVDHLEAGVSITASKAISGSEPCYSALAADLPAARWAYPVSLLIESFGQSAALLWLLSRADTCRGVLMFAAARDYVVLDKAFPGDTVQHVVRLQNVVADTAFVHGESLVDGRPIATVRSMIAVVRPTPNALDAAC